LEICQSLKLLTRNQAPDSGVLANHVEQQKENVTAVLIQAKAATGVFRKERIVSFYKLKPDQRVVGALERGDQSPSLKVHC
jgi:hypothetical protein